MECGKGRGDSRGLACETEVVQVREDELEAPRGAGRSKLLQDWVQRQREEERAERITLLDAAFRINDARTRDKLRRTGVAILYPRESPSM